MKSVSVYFVVLLIPLFEAAIFRCDYTYLPYGGGWFKLHNKPTHHLHAKRICLIEGAELVAPATNGIETAVKSLIDNTTVSSVHIDYEIMGELNKIPGFLKDNEIPAMGEEDSVWVFTKDGIFERQPAVAKIHFVCHKKAGAAVELNECGTLDNDYKLDSRTGHCYKFHFVRNTWSRALETCYHEGGNLAIINSETEADVIRDLFERNPTDSIPGDYWQDSAFLGFKSVNGGAWKTVYDHPLSMSGYGKWAPGEPNNARGDELCGTVGRNGLLYDDPCDREVPFICEKKIQLCDDIKRSEDLTLPIPLKRIKLTNLIESW